MIRKLAVVPMLLLALVLSPRTSSAAIQQCPSTPGAVVQLAGTPHLFIADTQGILHWGGDTRGLAGHFIDWSNRCEVGLQALQQARRGDPWLSSGLPKIGEGIFLSKWEDNEDAPTLLHIQSIADVELFGINTSNYGDFVMDGPVWSQRYGFDIGLLELGPLASAESFAWPEADRAAYSQLLRNMQNVLSTQSFQAYQAGAPPALALPPIVGCERDGLNAFEQFRNAGSALSETQECLARLSMGGAGLGVPNAPTNVNVAAAGPSAVDVSWDGVAAAIGYRIYGGDQQGPSATLVTMVPANVTSHRVTELSPNRNYCYAVATLGPGGESVMGRSTCATTASGEGPAPTLLGVSPASSEGGLMGLRIDWMDRTNNETGFQIWRGEQMIATVGPNTSSYVDLNWTPASAFCYWVVATTPTGQATSQPSCIGTTGLWPPAPTGLMLTERGPDLGVLLNWTDGSANEQGFRILRNGQTVASVSANVTSFTDFPPPDFGGITGRATCYRVIAFNNAGETSSNQACRAR